MQQLRWEPILGTAEIGVAVKTGNVLFPSAAASLWKIAS